MFGAAPARRKNTRAASVLERTLTNGSQCPGKGDSQAMTDPTAAAPESKSPESVPNLYLCPDLGGQLFAGHRADHGRPGSLPILGEAPADLKPAAEGEAADKDKSGK